MATMNFNPLLICSNCSLKWIRFGRSLRNYFNRIHIFNNRIGYFIQVFNRLNFLLLIFLFHGCHVSSDALTTDEDYSDVLDSIEIEKDSSEFLEIGMESAEQDDTVSQVCESAQKDLGYLVCRYRLESSSVFEDVSQVDTTNTDIERISKYLLPAQKDAPLPLLFQNVNRFVLHFDLLRVAFPMFYGSLTAEGYADLVLNNKTRAYFAGAILSFRDSCKGHRYGFTVYQNRQDQTGIDVEKIAEIQTTLGKVLPETSPLYFPMNLQDEKDVTSWLPGKVLVHDCGKAIDFEVYNQGIAVGYVRLFDEVSFAYANSEVSYGWQDLLILESAPFDIETVIAGIVTGDRQTPLSHVNVRASRRGTPNLFIRNSLNVFSEYEGKLIRLTVHSNGYEIDDQINEQDAQIFWETIRPSLSGVVSPDWKYSEFPSLIEVPTATLEQRETSFSRFGGKGANLAILSSLLDADFVVNGFLIPFRYYKDYLRNNKFVSTIGLESSLRTYEEHISEMVSDPEFLTDPVVRKEMLNTISEHMRRKGDVPDELVDNLAIRIEEVFDSRYTMVRFRSSSNIEDSIDFSGAGLYASRSACAADFDPDANASYCDVQRNDPRLIEDALRRVWASFWEPRAFEERLYYQFIDPKETAMGIVVTPAFLNEVANGVVFTGLPQIVGDPRMQVNSQVGEVSVVSPPVGVLPESALLSVEGDAVSIDRCNVSSLVSPPAVVISDELYQTMGLVLDDLRQRFPMDFPEYDPEEIVLDLEFKIRPDNRLMFKQVRPFLRTAMVENNVNEVRIDIEENLVLCGRFRDGRDLQKEYELRTQVELFEESFVLPTDGELPERPLIRSVRFGPEKTELIASSDPQWTCESFESNNTSYFRYKFQQAFSGGDKSFLISWEAQTSAITGHPPIPIDIDEEKISEFDNGWSMEVNHNEENDLISLMSCSFESLPRFKRKATLPSGDRIELNVCFRQALMGSGPAGLLGATYVAQDRQILVEDYFRLAYGADHHNWKERFLVVSPDIAPGVWAIAIRESFPFNPSLTVVEMLDEQGEVIESITPLEYSNLAQEN